ncbi:hypothetical protein EB118_21395 [bacterium]|nr:hypothetical protein [bacterium]
MATTTNLTTTYAGKVAGGYIRAALLSNESLKGVTVLENVDYKAVVRRLTDSITFADATCDFTPSGTVTLNEKILELKKFQIHREICKGDLNTSNLLYDWDAKETQDGVLPVSLTDALIANILGGAAAANETMIWQGLGTANTYKGFCELIQDAGDDQNAGSGALTSATIVGAVEDLVDACPDAVKGSTEKPIIYMSLNAWEAYMIASAAAGNGWYTYGGPEMPKQYLGYQIFVCPGLYANHMLMTQKSNLYFGTNLLNQWNEVKVLDMSELDGSDNVRFKCNFFAGAQIGFTNEIATWGTNF